MSCLLMVCWHTGWHRLSPPVVPYDVDSGDVPCTNTHRSKRLDLFDSDKTTARRGGGRSWQSVVWSGSAIKIKLEPRTGVGQVVRVAQVHSNLNPINFKSTPAKAAASEQQTISVGAGRSPRSHYGVLALLRQSSTLMTESPDPNLGQDIELRRLTAERCLQQNMCVRVRKSNGLTES